jgi:hypothetical protein
MLTPMVVGRNVKEEVTNVTGIIFAIQAVAKW